MRILFVAAEVAPFAKVGGLADVAGALPQALATRGHDVRVVMPRYSSIDLRAYGLSVLFDELTVQGDDGAPQRCRIWEGRNETVPVYFVENDEYLTRKDIYASDDLERFTLFCRAVLETARQLKFRPEVLHANDWHTSVLPAWVSLGWGADDFWATTASVLTIHNLAFQGWFDEAYARRWDLLPQGAVSAEVAGVRLNSLMAQGIRHADLISTVSPTYAEEILTAEQGFGLDPLLAARRDRLFGVLNGIDTKAFDPETDPEIKPNYGTESLDRKAEVKAALQKEVGLPVDPLIPVLGVVGRLTDQKGFDLMLPALRELADEWEFQLVLLGTGEAHYHEALTELAKQYPNRFKVFLRFDAKLAQRIYAGSEIFAMPSRFEPCGLGQMIALRYGTVPVVRSTGGLRDTIQDWDRRNRSGNGFLFNEYRVTGLVTGLVRALETYRHAGSWRNLMDAGVAADHSWDRSAERYEELYERARDLKQA